MIFQTVTFAKSSSWVYELVGRKEITINEIQNETDTYKTKEI